ncbi:hypothetical protein PENSPDRAFT_670071 [Peniophora sp. CONT]|nr:hypothetical protein PENSPDRAFT_670071 [Peniophora sp. CONT]
MRLPVELIDAIFVIVATQCPPVLGSKRDCDLGWRALMCVCKLWNDIFMANKRLWAIIHAHDPSTMRESIQRAGKGLLEYRMDICEPRCLEVLDDSVEAVASRNFDATKYKSVYVARHDAAVFHLRKMFEPGSETLPDLESLHLSCSSLGPNARHIARQLQHRGDIRVLCAPNLRIARFRGLCVSIQSNILQVLDVDLSMIDRFNRPELVSVRDMLARVSHCLEELYLRHAVGLCIAERNPISFPVLKTLEVSGTSMEVQSVLDRVTVPSSAVRAMSVLGQRGQVGGLGTLLSKCLSGARWDRLILRAPHMWEDDVILYVEASGSMTRSPSSVDRGALPVARIELTGRFRMITSWILLARRVLEAVGRDGLDVHLEIPDGALMKKPSGALTLREDTYEQLGGRALDRLNVTVDTSCFECRNGGAVYH